MPHLAPSLPWPRAAGYEVKEGRHGACVEGWGQGWGDVMPLIIRGPSNDPWLSAKSLSEFKSPELHWCSSPRTAFRVGRSGAGQGAHEGLEQGRACEWPQYDRTAFYVHMPPLTYCDLTERRVRPHIVGYGTCGVGEGSLV